MKISSKKYLLIYLIVLVFPLSLVAICSYFIPKLNNIAFNAYYIYYGGISLSITSLLMIILTSYLLKHNLKDNKETLDNNYILRVNLIFLIFHLLITIISYIFNYYNISNYFIYALYIFYPLIYFCIILFLESKKLTKKNVITILLSIYLLWYVLIPIIYFLINNNQSIKEIITLKSLVYNLFYNYLKYALLVMPFISLALIKITNEEKDKSLVHKFNFSTKKLIIFAIISSLITISVMLLVNR